MGSVVPNTGLSGKVRVNIMKKRVWKLLTVAMVAVMLLTGCGAEKIQNKKEVTKHETLL